MARLEPIPPEDWPDGMRVALGALRPAEPRHPFPERRPDRPKGLNILGTFAHHPTLATAFHTFNGHILFGTTLTQRQRELLVLRVASLRDCAYEWAQHAVLAADVGLDPDEIDRVHAGPDDPAWDALDAAMIRAVDELLAEARVAEGTWAVLAGQLDAQQLMDLVFTVGAYDALAMAMGAFEVELDADLTESPPA